MMKLTNLIYLCGAVTLSKPIYDIGYGVWYYKFL